ncbi:MAG: 50S ribosome-binding GTPase [Micropruina sp.]|uniref:GTPase n=1 Tax=Micropruina sp. TaxID=2737536 RepID=UPI0039E27BCD
MSRTLAQRLQALDEAVELSRDRSSAAVVDRAAAVVKRAGERGAFSGDHTVVALAGATGSGKSTSFNAISGTEFATTGVRRPTTSTAMAVAWGTELPGELLDWLDVPRRHLVPARRSAFANLVLLDLPDHDSTEAAHRMTVDRLVPLVDMLIWVVDPQKYADAALHDRYLRPLAPYAEVMIVVLNQSDRLQPDDLADAMADLRRLLDAEGLAAARLISMSALDGTGVPELRQLLAQAVADKAVVSRRIAADVTVAAEELAAELGTAPTPTLDRKRREPLVQALAEASGVGIAVDGVRDAWKLRGGVATGWPFVTWLARLKPDPLRALRLDQSDRRLAPTAVSRTSLPGASSVQRARLDRGLRELVDAASTGLPRGWAAAVRSAARGREALLMDRLDTAIAGADLELDRGTGWWSVVRLLQWLLMVAVVVGGLWTLFMMLAPALGLAGIPTVYWWGWPAQFILLAGGVLGGLLLAGLSSLGVSVSARAKAHRAERVLHRAIGQVTDAELIAPVEDELDRHRRAVQAVRNAR